MKKQTRWTISISVAAALIGLFGMVAAAAPPERTYVWFGQGARSVEGEVRQKSRTGTRHARVKILHASRPPLTIQSGFRAGRVIITHGTLSAGWLAYS